MHKKCLHLAPQGLLCSFATVEGSKTPQGHVNMAHQHMKIWNAVVDVEGVVACWVSSEGVRCVLCVPILGTPSRSGVRPEEMDVDGSDNSGYEVNAEDDHLRVGVAGTLTDGHVAADRDLVIRAACQVLKIMD